MKPPSGAEHLAALLGVSRQHATALLRSGRVVGAFKDEAGVWHLPPIPYEVKRGKRGPLPVFERDDFKVFQPRQTAKMRRKAARLRLVVDNTGRAS